MDEEEEGKEGLEDWRTKKRKQPPWPNPGFVADSRLIRHIGTTWDIGEQVDYRRKGIMEGQLGYTIQTHWWKSPRWIVIRIEALAVVAIIISFFLAVFGSCRRWSNSWIVQKGFFAAQVLSLSLGTYSIGLMQSSSVKSEMYPVWTVSLFTLFGCIDPVTTYNGLDYMGPLSEVVYRICLNFGYVLLMSIPTISEVVFGNAAIITLSAITFIKGFHRSFALVQQNSMQDVAYKSGCDAETWVLRKDKPLGTTISDNRVWKIVAPGTEVYQADIEASISKNKDKRLRSCYDACTALCLSHDLQLNIFGLDHYVRRPRHLTGIDYEWALKVIEIELALVYDAFFTGNPFLHYYQATAASLWALASFSGICFVLVATAIPGEISSRRPGASGCTKVVGTTTADRAITIGILGTLALLQLLQLVRAWTSTWARAAVACAYAMKDKAYPSNGKWWERGYVKLSGWLKLKVFVATSTNLFHRYLWQDKMSQHSILPEPRLLIGGKIKGERMSTSVTKSKERCRICIDLVQMLGLQYIWLVIRELFSSITNKTDSVKLDKDVKGSVIDFLRQIQSDTLDSNWLLSLPQDDQRIRHFLPHVTSDTLVLKPEVHCQRYPSCVMTWHIVTWYCELLAEPKSKEARMNKAGGCGRETAATVSHYLRKVAAAIPRPGYCFQRKAVEGAGEAAAAGDRDHRRVATALSQYCVYLVKFAPELLPVPVARTKHVYNRFAQEAKETRIEEPCDNDAILANMPEPDTIFCQDWYDKDGPEHAYIPDYRTQNGVALAKLLMRRYGPDQTWKILARVWVQLLVYAAPYGNAEAHMRRLSQGGEFITHLWALLYHLDIREWKVQGNLAEIITTEDADRILTEDSQALVAYLESKDDDRDELATASELEDGVRYYYTSDRNVGNHLGIGPIRSSRRTALVLLTKEANNHKPTFYDGKFRAYDIASFVTANKIALPQNQAPQHSSGCHGGQSEDGTEEEIQLQP